MEISQVENLLIPLNSSVDISQINLGQTLNVSGITFHVNENMYPGIDIPVDIDIYSNSAAPAYGDFRFEAEGIEESFSIIPGSTADVSVTVNNTSTSNNTK